MTILKALAATAVLIGGLTACDATSGNPLIGTWNIAQPNPPVTGQNVTTPCFSKLIFTKIHAESFWEGKSGGPNAVTYRTEGNIVWAAGQINENAYTFNGKDHMQNMSPYGLCFYVRA